MHDNRSWQPILEGAVAADAERAINEIAEALRVHLESGTASSGERADAALLFSYLASARRSDALAEVAFDQINQAGLQLAHLGRSTTALYGGLAGFGWRAHHLAARHGVENPDEDPLSQIDEAVLKDLSQATWGASYDLIQGLVGLSVYWLERFPNSSATAGLKRVLTHLRATAEVTGHTATWHTPAAALPPEQQLIAPRGYYNVGVAHGVPGVLYVLAELVAADIDSAAAKSLLNCGLTWLAAQQRDWTGGSVFPAWVAPGHDSQDTRLGWCYGDLGIGAVLFHIGDRLGLESADLGLNLLRRCAAFDTNRPDINDAGLCHGAIGVAHIFNRAWQLTGEDQFKVAAQKWYVCGLTQRRADIGFAGFFTYRASQPALTDGSFLSGAAGIALGLLAAVSAEEPQWDRLLLLSGKSISAN